MGPFRLIRPTRRPGNISLKAYHREVQGHWKSTLRKRHLQTDSIKQFNWADNVNSIISHGIYFFQIVCLVTAYLLNSPNLTNGKASSNTGVGETICSVGKSISTFCSCPMSFCLTKQKDKYVVVRNCHCSCQGLKYSTEAFPEEWNAQEAHVVLKPWVSKCFWSRQWEIELKYYRCFMITRHKKELALQSVNRHRCTLSQCVKSRETVSILHH